MTRNQSKRVKEEILKLVEGGEGDDRGLTSGTVGRSWICNWGLTWWLCCGQTESQWQLSSAICNNCHNSHLPISLRSQYEMQEDVQGKHYILKPDGARHVWERFNHGDWKQLKWQLEKSRRVSKGDSCVDWNDCERLCKCIVYKTP